MCHHNTFLIYGSIEEASEKKWEIVTHASIVTSLLVAILFGIAGYTTFKAYSQGTFLHYIGIESVNRKCNFHLIKKLKANTLRKY